MIFPSYISSLFPKFAKAVRVIPVIALASFVIIAVSSDLSHGNDADDRPYDDKLTKLSEVLGAVHYLRELCGADEGQLWRNQMRDLIDSEGTSALRRVKFVKSFNKGYRGFKRTYRNCTASAKRAIERFMREGQELAVKLVEQNK